MLLPSDVQRKTNKDGAIRMITGTIPLPVNFADSATTISDVADSVKAVLLDLSDDLQLASSDQGGLEISSVREVSDSVYVRLKETVNGIDVCGSDIVAEVSAGALRRVGISRHNDRVSTDPVDQAADSRPLTKRRAVSLVKRAIGDHVEVQSDAAQVYFPSDDGMHLCWQVDVVTETADWRYCVDAYTHDIYTVEDLREHVDGTGMVYDPNPVVTANDNTLNQNSPAATLDGELVSQTLNEITQVGANFKLDGPYVKIENKQAPAILPPEQANSTFNFTRNDDEFEAVNIYYHVDKIQRYLQNTLGISNVMNWSIPCDHHTIGGAFYSPAGLFMGFGDSGPTRPDRGEDGDVMAHEYGHAMQHDIVPGWGVFNTTTSRQEARAMGEGFGDALTCIFNQEGGGLFQPEVFEDWIFGPAGLRQVDGLKEYPGEGTTGTTGDWVNQVHADGEIWSATLWSAYLAAGGNSSSTATRATTRKEFLRSLILHHFKLNTDATMPEAAEALLTQNAEDPQTLGRQVIPMLDSFHDRNILSVANNVDLWLKDKPSHTGAETVTNPFWNSPDVWIRNSDDNGTSHQAPEFGQDNWFYARVRNRGSQPCRAFAVTFEIKIYQGLQFVYPNDFIPATATAVGFNLPAGGEQIVKALWPKSEVPSAGSHGCLLVSAYSATDEALAGKRVWEDNNLAQKNLTIVDLLPNDTADITFRFGNVLVRRPELFRIEVVRPVGLEALEVAIVHPNRAVVAHLSRTIERITTRPPGRLGTPGTIGGIGGIALRRAIAVERRPVLTAIEPARFRIGTAGGIGFDQDDDGLELNLAPGSEIFPHPPVDAEAGEASEEPLDPNFANAEVTIEEDDRGHGVIRFQPGRLVGFPFELAPRLHIPLKLRVKAPANSRRGDTHEVNLIQRDRRGRVVGGITVQINIV